MLLYRLSTAFLIGFSDGDDAIDDAHFYMMTRPARFLFIEEACALVAQLAPGDAQIVRAHGTRSRISPTERN